MGLERVGYVEFALALYPARSMTKSEIRGRCAEGELSQYTLQIT